MIKTSIIPHNNTLQLSIPTQYIGKELEVLVYAKEELDQQKESKTDMARFKGVLTAEEANQLHNYINQARNEWDSGI
jgi:hypothetical protein